MLDPLMSSKKTPDRAAWISVAALAAIIGAIVLLSILMGSW